MSVDALIEIWRGEEQRPFRGWDFSHLRGRMVETDHPWSYQARAATLLDAATAALDMDTGGGERLLALHPHWPGRIVATEAYPPNVRVAAARLAPGGASLVVAACGATEPMPFASGAFDLVLNRHGGFNPREVGRVLAVHGVFFTEQVHGLCVADLLAAFDVAPPANPGSAERYVPELKAAGLQVARVEDWSGPLIFTDVGAVVAYLKAIPWLVPGFSVATHAAHLLRLQERLERDGELRFTYRVYLIEAQKLRSTA